MDEVLFQFVEAVLERWNNEYDTTFKRDDINAWFMEDTLGPGSYAVITKWINEPNFFENLRPIPGAIEGLRELMKRGHDVVIATSVSGDVENAYDSKRRSLAKHVPEFDMKNFICTSRKGLLRGDVLIDDAAHYLADWYSMGNTRAVVMHARWNKDVKQFPRALDWKGVMSIITFWEHLDQFDEMQRRINGIKELV
jgi:5'(3')-deoxyribonucleotidase